MEERVGEHLPCDNGRPGGCRGDRGFNRRAGVERRLGSRHRPDPRPRTPAGDQGSADRFGHPQDPARRGDHAGEPVVRLVLRHLPRSQWHPCTRVRPEPQDRRVCCSVPQSQPVERGWSALPGQRRGRHRRRAHGRIRRPGAKRVLHLQRGRRDGLARRPRDHELLVLRPALRAPGRDVRTERLVESPRPPVHGFRVVSEMPRARRPYELRERRPSARLAPRRQARKQPELRLDRSHLPVVQEPRELGLLRGHR